MIRKSIFTALFALCALPLFAQNFRLPEYTKEKLPNGMELYMMPQSETPIVHLEVVFPVGSVHDGGKPGLALLTADALMHGAGDRTREQIEEAVEFLGASFYTYGGTEYSGISAEFLRDDFNTIWEIVVDVLTRPQFDANEFEKMKRRTVASLQQARESPRNIILDYWNAMLYPDHPYGSPSSGTIASVESISLEDVKAFYKKYFRPGGAAIILTGDVMPKAMPRHIKMALKDWKTGTSEAKAVGAPKMKLSKTRVTLVNKEDARETTFLIGGIGIPENHDDRVAIEVVNTVLGGRFTSWLNDALRVNSGLTYGARSQFDSRTRAGTFYISTFTAKETSREAIDMALVVLDSLHRNGIDEATLSSARNYVKGGFPPEYETPRQLAKFLVKMHMGGVDADYINKFQERVDAVTVKRANEIIRQYFPRENLQFLLIGRSEEIRELAKKYGAVTEKEIKEDGY